jgi:secreted trypsin-like serine protease
MARLAPLLVAALALGSCGVAPSTAAEAIIQGTPEAASPWVVMVVQVVPGTTRVKLCSGAVVAPRVVLTAKHCVYRSVTGSATWELVPRAELSVRTGTNFRSAERTVTVASVRTTDGPYRDNDGRSGGDIAVLTLDEALEVTPKRISRTPAAAGDVVRIVGFGYTQPGAADPADLGGLHRGEATVQTVEANVFSTTGSQWTCTGDSGGPALHPGRDELVGVVSIGPTGCRVSTSYYTRVDRYLSLFDGLLPEAPSADASAVADASADAPDAPPADAAAPSPASRDGGCDVQPRPVRKGVPCALLGALAWLAARRRSTRPR